MDFLIYSLCALTALLCTWLLLRAYSRTSNRLLLWGGVCFAGLTLNNLFVVLDKFVVPDSDLSIVRLLIALASSLVFLYGLVWDSE